MSLTIYSQRAADNVPVDRAGETFKRSLAFADRLRLKALHGPDEDEVYDEDDSVNGEYEEAGGPNLFWE